MEWYLKVVRDNYANFSGRARRKEYWMFFLLNTICVVVTAIMDNVLGTTFTLGEEPHVINLPYGWIYLLYLLAVLIPSIALFVRRMHDVGKSGWWFFIGLIPLVGAIWLLVLLCTDGNPGGNNYGPSPKAVTT